MENHEIFLIVPAHNEAPVIRRTLLPLLEKGYTVVVVDDGSTDTTSLQVQTLKEVHLIRHFTNLGQGAALQTGNEYALKRGAEVIVHFDADGQHDPEDIPLLVQPIAENKVEVSLGSRFLKKGGVKGMPWRKWLILKGGIMFTAVFSGLMLTDTHNGFKAFSRSAAQQITIRENRMAHASEILHLLARLKLTYAEVPVRVTYSEYSRQKGQPILSIITIVVDIFLGRVFR